jgi:hypothetical protein
MIVLGQFAALTAQEIADQLPQWSKDNRSLTIDHYPERWSARYGLMALYR